mmetsp:Transcript_5331/g.7984  ORF Transcript_5331/g.7984 Transcript_5331/m.7984 type:complete len:390 (+) Transcript_5331:366-1535(+)
MASPDWGCSSYKDTSESFPEVYDQVIAEQSAENIELNQSFGSFEGDFKEVTLMKEEFVEAAREAREELESPLKKPQIAKLQLDKIEKKPCYEKYSTKPESHLEAIFEELISYCNLDQEINSDYSFSAEKYEYALNLFKEKEDERKEMAQEINRLKFTIEDLQSQLLRANEVKTKALKSFRSSSNRSHYYKQLLQELQNSYEALQQDNSSLSQSISHEKEKLQKAKTDFESQKELLQKELERTQTEANFSQQLKKELQELKQENSKVKQENEFLSAQMTQGQNDLMDKIRELEIENEKIKKTNRLRLNSSFDGYLSNRSRQALSPVCDLSLNTLTDMSYFRKLSDDGVLVNKQIGQYIQKLLSKINRFSHKIKQLRAQRDKLKKFYDQHK